MLKLTQDEYGLYQRLMADLAGVHLAPEKRALVQGRLAKRLSHHQLRNYLEYYQLATKKGQEQELQIMLDLITTHETRFFREPAHYHFLAQKILRLWNPNQTLRMWSAACSSGEEVYSLAMVLYDYLGTNPWEIFASDISTQTLATATQAIYPIEKTKDIAPYYLSRYCRKGVRSQTGFFSIVPELKDRTKFQQINLNENLPNIGMFDCIFLRNVLIYFSPATRKNVIKQIVSRLHSGAFLCVGHAEYIPDHNNVLKHVHPAVYKRL